MSLAWQERGEGPLVVLVNQFFGRPETFDALFDDLTRDHRLVTYDPRGIGESTRRGPYTFEADADDLEAVLELQDEPGSHPHGTVAPVGERDQHARLALELEHGL